MVLAGEVKSSFRKLYAGNKREGVLPICGKGTVTKLRNLWQEGRLQPYWDYLREPSEAQKSEPLDPAMWSELGIRTRALILREWLDRLVQLLEIHCGGTLIVLSDEVDIGYIRWRNWFRALLASPGLEDLQEAFPELPSSLHSLGEDADDAWEYDLRQSLNSYKGRVLEFCVDLGVEPNDKLVAAIREELKPTDKFLRSFRDQKARIERQFVADIEKGSSSESSKSGPTPEGSPEPDERPKPTGA